MKKTLRQGSALLIVLGMLSFMVISAIGFAVYMRQNRLPSSFVRRNTSAHQLLQAALARAMNELDSAIGEDQFPGVRNATTSNPIKGGENTRYIDDSWVGRVFMGALTNVQISVSSRTNLLASADSTISTLSLEGLAYLPPALVNDVRYFSKRTPTAQWRTLAYDAGRYAYTAINVSDYFDVNSVGASARFGTPSNRVSIAYLFTNRDGIFDADKAKKFEQFRKNTLSSDKEMVSIADYNLRLGSSTFDAPFVDFVNGENGSSYAKFYGNGDTNFLARSLFVTDSYQGEKVATNSVEKIDLSKKEHQPFNGQLINGGSKQLNMEEIYLKNSFFASTLKSLGLDGGRFEKEAHMALCDYLDENSIPSSLAIPTTERVPMIAGVELINAKEMSYEIERKTGVWDNTNFNPSTGEGPKKEDIQVTRKVTYSLKSLGVPGQFHVRVLPVYPFKYHPDLDDNFEVDAMMNVFLGIGNFGMRGGSATEGNFDLVSSDLFVDAAGKDVSGKTSVHNDTLRLTCASEGSHRIQLPNTILKESDALAGGVLDLSFQTPSISGDVLPLLVTTETWKWTAMNSSWKFVSETVKDDEKHASPISGGATGFTVRSAYTGNYEALKTADIKPYLAVRLRVKLGNKTVDLVPASCGDDTPLNGLANCANAWLRDNEGSEGDLSCPVLLFGGPSLEQNPFSLEALNNSDNCLFGKVHDKNDSTKSAKVKFNIENKTLYCADPRYNHAPENWVTGTGSLSMNSYLTVAHAAMNHKGGEKDIFMSVSDQGYLQSISELAMLPRTTKLTSNGSNVLLGKITSNQTDFQASGSAKDQKCFFRSLPLTKDFADPEDKFSVCRDSEDDEDCLEYAFVEDLAGFKINPYSDDPEILKGAFKLTPYDWRAAGTNGVSDLSAPENFDKAFCADPDDKAAKIDDKKLNEMIEEFVAAMRETRSGNNGNSKTDWISIFNSLDWKLDETGGLAAGQEDSTLFGADLGVNLHSIDRKYLYGFWRDCFAVNQQLFIIFLRAEPTILGGGSGKGSTRAQLGGRAVAVVWRDPSSPKVETNDSKNKGQRRKVASWQDPPHRMRVLFYKTLE